MNILLHICCGPCSIMPMVRLLEEGHRVTGYFYNPNIHPLSEYLRRREGAAQAAAHCGVPLILAAPEDYNPENWIRRAFHAADSAQKTMGSKDIPPARCVFCLTLRLERTGALAAAENFDAFSSSLLYSRHQAHSFIAGQGSALAQTALFLYRDFRVDWQQGITRSKEWRIYRQQYCGCLFSEYDRYARQIFA